MTCNARLDNLPPDARRELERYGVVDWTSTLRRQQQAAGQCSLEYADHLLLVPEVSGRPHHRGDAPISSGAAAVLFRQRPGLLRPKCKRPIAWILALCVARAVSSSKRNSRYCAGYELKYVLTTAGNWLGPIQNYRLTVDKSAVQCVGVALRRRHQARRPDQFRADAGKLRP